MQYKCPKCGTENKSGSKFCTSCGEQISNEDSLIECSPIKENQEEEVNNVTNTVEHEKKGKKLSKKKIILIILIPLIVIILLLAIIIFVFNSDPIVGTYTVTKMGGYSTSSGIIDETSVSKCTCEFYKNGTFEMIIDGDLICSGDWDFLETENDGDRFYGLTVYDVVSDSTYEGAISIPSENNSSEEITLMHDYTSFVLYYKLEKK